MENKLKEALKKLGIETAEQLNAAIRAERIIAWKHAVYHFVLWRRYRRRKLIRVYKIKFNPVSFRKEKPRRMAYEALRKAARIWGENLAGKNVSE